MTRLSFLENSRHPLIPRFILAALAVGLSALFLACSRPATPESYPSRKITVYINSSQGGGTDQWARYLSAGMEKHLGTKMVCINLPGAKGGAGAMKVHQAPADGYTLLACSETVVFFGVNDVGPTVDNWKFLIAGGSAGVIAVLEDSDWVDVDQFLQAARSDPSQLRIANSGAGKLWHLKAVQLESKEGAEFKHIPYNGSAPAITALLSGEVHAVSCSLSEIQEYVRSGKARILFHTDDLNDRSGGLQQWLGFAIPRGADEAIYNKLAEAFTLTMNAPETKAWIEENQAQAFGLTGEAAKQWTADMEATGSWAVHDAGLAKKHPEELGLSR